LQFISVRQRLYYNVCIFIFKILNNIFPEALRNKFGILGSDRERQTRRTANIVINFRRTRSTQKSMFDEVVKMYNSLQVELKQCERLNKFKRMLKDYILSSIIS